MAKAEKERKREEKEIRVEGLFSGIGKMISSVLNLADKMMKEGKETAERKGEIKAKIGGKPARISYGYRVGLGLRSGMRKAEEKPKFFKKVRKSEKIEKWKPVLDIFEKPKEIKVVAELPKGIKKKDIKIKVAGDKLKIITPKYSREAKLPCSVGNWSFKLHKTKLEKLLEIKLQKKK